MWLTLFNHLFIHSVLSDFFLEAYFYFLGRCGISWCFPSSLGKVIEAWRMVALWHCRLPFWKLIPFFHSLVHLEAKEWEGLPWLSFINARHICSDNFDNWQNGRSGLKISKFWILIYSYKLEAFMECWLSNSKKN